MGGRKPLAVSLRMSVSSPIAASANGEQERRHCYNPDFCFGRNGDQAIDADQRHEAEHEPRHRRPGDDALAAGSFFLAARAAINPSAITMGASSMTRDSFAIVANSPAFCPSWKAAATTCAIS